MKSASALLAYVRAWVASARDYRDTGHEERTFNRLLSNALDAARDERTISTDRVLEEVCRHVGAWDGVGITREKDGIKIHYTVTSRHRRPYFELPMSIRVEKSSVFHCDAGGPMTLLISLDESADRDIVAWVHEKVVGRQAMSDNVDFEDDDGRPVPRPNPTRKHRS